MTSQIALWETLTSSAGTGGFYARKHLSVPCGFLSGMLFENRRPARSIQGSVTLPQQCTVHSRWKRTCPPANFMTTEAASEKIEFAEWKVKVSRSIFKKCACFVPVRRVCVLFLSFSPRVASCAFLLLCEKKTSGRKKLHRWLIRWVKM